MAIRYYKRCPYCSIQYDSYNTVPQIKYGSPFITCRGCKKQFFDKDYKELAIVGINKENTKIITLPEAICALVVAILDGFIAYSGIKNIITKKHMSFFAILITLFCIVVTAFVLYMFIKVIKNRNSNIKNMEKELAESEARLQNKEYAQALALNGVEVPLKYLHPEFLKSSFLEKKKNKPKSQVMEIDTLDIDSGKCLISNKYCPKCGTIIPKGSNHCYSCGIKVEDFFDDIDLA